MSENGESLPRTPPMMLFMNSESIVDSPDACYLAIRARDARFDGRLFVGVTSTGIYCRPVCRVRIPRRENCRFFGHAAQAELAGFRPCLRCRPELAPGALAWSIEDAGRILAWQAARLFDEPDAWGAEAPSVEAVARRLGVSDRHLRRLFEAQIGVSPLQYLQTRRLLAAKQLLADTDLPVTDIAAASGFASLRRFNAAFVEHYRLSPSQLRREGTRREGTRRDGSRRAGLRRAGGHPTADAPDAGNTVDRAPGHRAIRLGYRPPYDAAAMLAFFHARRLAGVEWVCPDGATLRLARTLQIDHGGQVAKGWLAVEFDQARHQLVLHVSDTLMRALPVLIRRVRATFDLDADPSAINAALHADFAQQDGLRVPGSMDAYELAVRAILGQQITVAAARTLAQRLVQRFGEPIQTPMAELTHLFPPPAVLAHADADELGQMGIVRQRQQAIQALARAVSSGELALHPGAEVQATTAALQALPGIGPWTAQYIAMRALRWPDAFPAGDVAVQQALGVRKGRSAAQAAREALEASGRWRPWRSYAVLRLWQAGDRTSPDHQKS